MDSSNQQELSLIREGIALAPFYWRIVIRPHMWHAVIPCSLMLLGAMLDMLTVAIAVPLLNSVTNPSRAANNRVSLAVGETLRFLGIADTAESQIVALLAVASSLFVLRSGLSLLQQYCTQAIAHRLRRKIKSALFESSLRARYEDQARRGRGVILQDINGAGLVHSAIMHLGNLFTAVFNSMFILGLMVYLSWWGAVMVGGLAIVGVQGLRRIFDRRAYSYGRIIHELQRDLSKVEVDAIDGLKVVKAHVLESKMVERLQSVLATEERPYLRMVLFGGAPGFINEVVASLIVLTLGSVAFLWPSGGMQFPTLVAFLLAIRRVGPALASINASFVELNRVRRDLEAVEEVLHWTQQEKLGQRGVEAVYRLRLADVSFFYEARPEHCVLRGVDLTMDRGTVTALVGPTGSGKSTIANLVIGLYSPRSGTILVNDSDLQQLSLRAWRQKVGYVCQDIFLFNATIRENIALWDETISQEEVEWAVRTAQLYDFVAALPEGYDTVVGDRGLRLSGGQCQRVAIARAILRHPEVLVFDEATSALDNLTERAVYGAINALRKEAVVIVIAHRLGTVKDADQIAVLSAGRVVEVGTHESLIETGGVYAELYQHDLAEGSADPAPSESRGTLL